MYFIGLLLAVFCLLSVAKAFRAVLGDTKSKRRAVTNSDSPAF